MEKLLIADRQFNSRLLIGTGKFASCELMAEAIEKSGTEIVTIALRRVDIEDENDWVSIPKAERARPLLCKAIGHLLKETNSLKKIQNTHLFMMKN